jgi:tRNA(Ile)-lysidine synthase
VSRRSAVASPAAKAEGEGGAQKRGAQAGRAVDPDRFAARLMAFGGFERRPHIAVAVSGGPDSLALALLSAAWAKQVDGRVTGLVVDHGLRPESAAEAARTVDLLRAQGFDAVLLRWDGPCPSANLQAKARAARYRLLEGWCAENQVLHLLIGQHRDDQIETLLQRLDRGSGIDGLAGVAAVSYRDFGRLLRPLLEFPKADLIATCQQAGVAWVEDPGNRSDRFARSRLRGVLARSLDTPPARLAAAASHAARARAALEQATADMLAQTLKLDPAGFAWLEVAPLRAAPDEILLRALSVAGASVAGAAHPPRLDRLERLADRLLAAERVAGVFGGCLWRPARDERWLIVREPAAIGPAAPLEKTTVWDDRFHVSGGWAGLTVQAFDAALQAEAKANGWIPPHRNRMPRAAWASLPALCDLDGLVAAPHLLYCRSMEEAGKVAGIAIVFHPRQPFANAGGHGPAFMASAAARKSFR